MIARYCTARCDIANAPAHGSANFVKPALTAFVMSVFKRFSAVDFMRLIVDRQNEFDLRNSSAVGSYVGISELAACACSGYRNFRRQMQEETAD